MRIIFTLALMASTLAAVSAPLVPDDALAAAYSRLAQNSRLKAPAEKMELVSTVKSEVDDRPLIYIFSSDSGFIIASADDNSTPLLGYSNTSSFNPADVPPAMEEWIQQYASGIESKGVVNATAAERAPIDPLISTKWAQSAPFNNDCPVHSSGKTIAGCGAVAMAQICKYYNWPPQGEGSVSYTYWANGTQYTEGCDFETPFNYDLMLDEYDSEAGYTDEQAAAVAKLMRACGAAARSRYTESATESTNATIITGMTDYLRYRADAMFVLREWYTADEWCDLIYNEFSQDRPVLYCGKKTTGGHAFVCDGYSADNFFHFNWGWGGYSDGYFLMGNQFPIEQQVLIGLTPNYNGESIPPMALMGMTEPLCINGSSFSKTDDDNIILTPKFLNLSNREIHLYTGLMLVDGNGEKTYIPYNEGDFDESGYMFVMLYKASEFPEGTYDVYPAFRSDDYDWAPMRLAIDKGSVDHLRFEVTDSRVTLIEGTEADKLSITPTLYDLGSMKCTMCDDYDYYPHYTGHKYYYSFRILFNRECWGNIHPALFKQNNDGTFKLKYEGEDKPFHAPDFCIYYDPENPFSLTLPDDAAAGYYYIGMIMKHDGEVTMLGDPSVMIYVSASPHQQLNAQVSHGGVELSKNTENILSADAKIDVDLEGVYGEFDGTVTLQFVKTVKPLLTLDPVEVNLSWGQSANVTFENFASSLNANSFYKMSVVDDKSNVLAGPFKVKFTEDSGIESVNSPSVTYQYFDINGRPVNEPNVPGVYIRKSVDSVEKVMIK